MATAETAARIRPATRSQRLVSFITRSPLHIVLVAIALIVYSYRRFRGSLRV